MLLQVLPLKLKEGFALTMFKLLAKEVFMKEVPHEMVKFTSFKPASSLINMRYPLPKFLLIWRAQGALYNEWALVATFGIISSKNTAD